MKVVIFLEKYDNFHYKIYFDIKIAGKLGGCSWHFLHSSFLNFTPSFTTITITMPNTSFTDVYRTQTDDNLSILQLTAGDYVLVWGDIDDDGFLEGELLDGRLDINLRRELISTWLVIGKGIVI